MNTGTITINNTQTFSILSILFLTSIYNGPGDRFILLTLCWFLLAAILIIQLCQSGAANFSLPTDRVSLIFYLLIFFFLMNLLTTKSVSHTVFALWAYLIPFFVFLFLRKSQSVEFQNLLSGIIFFGTASAIFAIFEFLTNKAPYTTGQRIDPNTFADLMICIVCPAMALYLSQKLSNLAMRLYEVIIFIVVLALLLTDSRAGLLIWLLGSSAIISYCIKHKTILPQRLGKLSLVLVFSTIIFVAAPGEQYSMHDLKTTNTKELSAVDIRLKMWSSTWQMIQDKPITGSGLGTFAVHYPAYRSAEEHVTSGTTPHNDYLQFLQEGGIAIFILFCCLMLVALYYFFIFFFEPKKKNSSKDTIYFSLSAAIMGLAIHALINFVFVTPMLMTITAIYLAGVCRVKGQEKTIKPFNRFKPRLATFSIGLITLVPLAALSADSIIDNLFNPSSVTHNHRPLVDSTKPQSLFNNALLLSDLRNKNIFSRSYITQQLSYAYKNSENPDEQKKIGGLLEEEYKKYINACELCSQPYIKLAGVYNDIGENVLADEYYRNGIAIDPTKAEHQLEYARFLIAQGKGIKANNMLIDYRNKWSYFLEKRQRSNEVTKINKFITEMK